MLCNFNKPRTGNNEAWAEKEEMVFDFGNGQSFSRYLPLWLQCIPYLRHVHESTWKIMGENRERKGRIWKVVLYWKEILLDKTTRGAIAEKERDGYIEGKGKETGQDLNDKVSSNSKL